MKAFKAYLTESKRTYDFRVRIANCDLNSDMLDKIELGLKAFDLADITKPKSQPVAHCNEFAALGPVARHQFEIKLNYPTTNEGVRSCIHRCSGIPAQQIVVRGVLEDDMVTDETSGDMSVNLGNDELKDQPGAQDHVGEKRKESLLKQLIADRTEPTQQTGVNDAILAKSLPKEKAAKTSADAPQNNTSPVSKPKHKINPRGK
jgi:hypothetical protein